MLYVLPMKRKHRKGCSSPLIMILCMTAGYIASSMLRQDRMSKIAGGGGPFHIPDDGRLSPKPVSSSSIDAEDFDPDWKLVRYLDDCR